MPGVFPVTFMFSTIIGLAILTWSSALGSHLTLPGSQDLSPRQESDHQTILRQLEKINNYTSPHSLPDLDINISPKIDHSVLPTPPLHMPATELTPEGSQRPHSNPVQKPIHMAVLLPDNHTQDQVKIGWRSLLNGRPKDAIAAYQESLRTHPHSADAYIGMGIALKSLGNIEHAKQAIQQALELNPQLSSALVHLGYLYADGYIGNADRKTAHRLFKQAAQLGDPFAGIALLDLQTRSSPRS
ncbi:MAG TPA: tetratricopeptide repeat protein [Nitrospirales bacterium]|nr:tetratricopeptide repeat protein [Nitrospirales bacterium]